MQVRLLTTSAGDAERMPEDEDSLQGTETNDKKNTEFEINEDHINRLRKSSKIKNKSHIVDNLIGRKFKVEYKKPTSPVSNKYSGSTPKSATDDVNINDLVRMGMNKSGPFSIGNKLKNKMKK